MADTFTLSFTGTVAAYRSLFTGADILQELEAMGQKADELKARLESIGTKTAEEHTEVMAAISELQQKISDLSGGATEAEMEELQALADALEESVTHVYDAPTPEEPEPGE